MGDNYQIIADLDATAEEAGRLAEQLRAWLFEQHILSPVLTDWVFGDEDGYSAGEKATLATGPQQHHLFHGVQFLVGRNVFYSIWHVVKCRSCAREFEPDTGSWAKAIDAWYAGDDTVSLDCPHCGHIERLTEWDGPWPWAFGHLGVQFWNWPPLSSEFIQQVAERLGHRVRLVCGRV